MKKISIIISALAVVFCSCSKEQDARLLISNQDTNVVSFKAFFEGEDPETKLGINTSSGALNWANGDAIAVQMTDNTFVPFTYSSSTKEFSATLGAKEVKDGGVAYYPASIAIDGTPGSVNLPTSYTIAADATVCPPMIATVNLGAKALSLKHLGGILSIKVSHVPTDANKLILTIPGKTVTGTFAVTDDTDDYISAGTGSGSVTLNFTKGVFGTTAPEFFFPVPVTTFSSGFTVDFKNAANETLYTHSTAKTTIEAARASIKRMAPLTVPVKLYINSPKPWGAATEYAYLSDDVLSWPGTSYNPDSRTITHEGNTYTKVIDDISAAGSSSNIIIHVNYNDSGDAPWYDPYGKLYRIEIPSVDISNDVYLTLSTNTDGTHKILLRNWSSSGYMDYFHAWYDGGSNILGDFPGTAIASMSSIKYEKEDFRYFTATKDKKIGVKAVYYAEKDWNQTNNGWIESLNENYLVTFKNNDTDPHVFGFPDVVATLD